MVHKRLSVSLIFILTLAVALRLLNLNQSFWLDEAAQVIESSRHLSQQLNIAADFHPPLYHLVLHFWLKLGSWEWLVRLPSVVFGVLSIYFAYLTGRVLFNQKVAILSALLLSVSGFHLWYSQETRPYMLFTFTAVASTYFLIQKRWIWYGIFSFASLYTMYFAPFLLLGHLVYVFNFEKKDLKVLLIIYALICAGFLPWMPNFLTQLQTGTGGFFAGWTDIVSQSVSKGVPLTFAKFILGKGSIDNNILYMVLVLPVFLIFLFSLYKLYESNNGRKLQVLFIVPLTAAFVVSFFIPILAPQRMIFLLPLFYLIQAYGINKLLPICRSFAISIVFITTFLSAILYFTNPYIQREQWRQAVSYVEKTSKKNSISLFAFPEAFAPYLWYSKGLVSGYGVAHSFRVTQIDLISLPSLDRKERVYFFQYLSGLTDPDGLTHTFLTQRQFVNTATVDFPGVGLIYVYDKI